MATPATMDPTPQASCRLPPTPWRAPIDFAALLDLRRPHRYPVRVLGEALVERGIYPGRRADCVPTHAWDPEEL